MFAELELAGADEPMTLSLYSTLLLDSVVVVSGGGGRLPARWVAESRTKCIRVCTAVVRVVVVSCSALLLYLVLVHGLELLLIYTSSTKYFVLRTVYTIPAAVRRTALGNIFTGYVRYVTSHINGRSQHKREAEGQEPHFTSALLLLRGMIQVVGKSSHPLAPSPAEIHRHTGQGHTSCQRDQQKAKSGAERIKNHDQIYMPPNTGTLVGPSAVVHYSLSHYCFYLCRWGAEEQDTAPVEKKKKGCWKRRLLEQGCCLLPAHVFCLLVLVAS